MIDQMSRNSHAELLRRLIMGRITNDDYELGLMYDVDKASQEVYYNGGWYLYSDTSEYRLIGRHSLDRKVKQEVARWIMFLRSEASYRWPSSPQFLFARRFLNKISGGSWFADSLDWYDSAMKSGDLSLWPFYDQEQYDEALVKPTFFTGVARANKALHPIHDPI